MSTEMVDSPRTVPAVSDPEIVGQAISRALRKAARKARNPPAILSAGGGGMTRRSGHRLFKAGLIVSFVLMVAAPIAVASIYWGLVASKQYATEMKFALRTQGEKSPLDGLAGALSMGASQQAQDSQIVISFLKSRAIVEALDKELNLRRIYATDSADRFSRMDDEATIEEVEKYWRTRIDTQIEALSGIVSVSVRAFTPEDSLKVATTVVNLSEKLVNDLSTRARRDALAQSQLELARAEQRMRYATETMRAARDAEGMLDASAAAEALNKVATTLRLELSKTEQEVAAQTDASPTAPHVRVLNARIASIKKQIDSYSRQIAGAKDQSSIANSLGRLSRAQVDVDLARVQYATASANFETARIDLETQHTYLVSFLKPTLAQKSTYPRRWWEWSVIAFPCLALWGLLVALALVVRDNMAK